MSDPEFRSVRAIDVVPYHWGIWCTVQGDPNPFVNHIVGATWSDDGKHIWWMLESHNFQKAEPDEMVELVPIEPSEFFRQSGMKATAERWRWYAWGAVRALAALDAKTYAGMGSARKMPQEFDWVDTEGFAEAVIRTAVEAPVRAERRRQIENWPQPKTT